MALVDQTLLWLKGLFGVHDGSTDGAGNTVNVDAVVKRLYEGYHNHNQDSAATTTNVALHHVFSPQNDIEILSVEYTGGALTNNTTNYAVMGLLSGNGSATPATAVASFNTAATNMSADTPTDLTLTAANVNVDAGETIAYRVLKYGAGGLTVGRHCITIHYRER